MRLRGPTRDRGARRAVGVSTTTRHPPPEFVEPEVSLAMGYRCRDEPPAYTPPMTARDRTATTTRRCRGAPHMLLVAAASGHRGRCPCNRAATRRPSLHGHLKRSALDHAIAVATAAAIQRCTGASDDRRDHRRPRRITDRAAA